MNLSTFSILLSLTTVQLMGAQAVFRSGSNGSHGALDIQSPVLLDPPPDGVYHCTTLKIGPEAVVRFNRNAANTPIYILAQGHVVIAGIIDVSGLDGDIGKAGKGGPGGYDGGEAVLDVSRPFWPVSDGHGPGGGQRGPGSFATAGILYGNTLLNPLIGGSGGSGHAESLPLGVQPSGGGGGGGAILIASDTSIEVTGGILANGGSIRMNSAHPGSGGGIRLVSPKVMGTGRLSAIGGAYGQGGARGGLGRLRVDTIDDKELKLSYSGVARQGREMYVLPPNDPKLELIEVAGNNLTTAGVGLVNLTLLPGAPTNQLVKVRTRGFVGPSIIEARVIPEIGQSRLYTGSFTGIGSQPVEVSLEVGFNPDMNNRLQVWSR